MQLIQAFIRNERLQDVQTALEAVGVRSYTVSATIGSGARHTGDAEDHNSLRQNLKFEVAVGDWQESQVVNVIRKAAGNDAEAEGIILVLPISRAVKIRSGVEGEAHSGRPKFGRPPTCDP